MNIVMIVEHVSERVLYKIVAEVQAIWHVPMFKGGGGSMVNSPKILVCYQRWDISIIKNCKILALECFLFEVKRTFGSKVMVN